MKKQIVMASGNKGKIKEAQEILNNTKYAIKINILFITFIITYMYENFVNLWKLL